MLDIGYWMLCERIALEQKCAGSGLPQRINAPGAFASLEADRNVNMVGSCRCRQARHFIEPIF
jgi:hypothetical protein